MAKEKLEKRKGSISSIWHKIKKGVMATALAATLIWWTASCNSDGWKPGDRIQPRTEQNDNIGTLEIKVVTEMVKKNPDGTYSLYSCIGNKKAEAWKKLSWDYVSLYSSTWWCYIWEKIIDGKSKFCLINASWLEISDYYEDIGGDLKYQDAEPERISDDVMAKWPGEYSFTATINGKKVLIKDWKEISWQYDAIDTFDNGIIWKKGGKEYYENNWVVVWPVDDVYSTHCFDSWEPMHEYSGEVVWVKNNGQNEFHYNWKKIFSLPLSVSNDECAIVLSSFHFVEWNVCYTYPSNWWSVIVLWEKTIKTKYSFVENVQQNSDWTITYVWWNEKDEADWHPIRVFIVTWNTVTEINWEKDWWDAISQVIDPSTSLAFYQMYGYFNE